YAMPSPSYSSTNSSVASVNGSTGQVSCLAGGTATINATMNFTDYYWTGPYDGNECVAEPFQTQTSPGGGMTVQKPTSATIIENLKTTYSNQTATQCDGTIPIANQYGYRRCVTYQVKDQNSPAQDINAVLSVHEDVSVVDSNRTSTSFTGDSETNVAG